MPDNVCQKCDNSGYIAVEKEGIRNFKSYCDCAVGQQERQDRWHDKLKDAGILKEYWDLHFGNFDAQNDFSRQMIFRRDVEFYLKNIDEKRREGLLWVIFGYPGTGKTLGASLILKQALKKDYTVKYTIWTDLTDEIFDKDEQLVKRLREVDFLVIDDLGRDKISKESRFAEDLLEKIIKHRYSNKLPTLLISSIEYTELQRRFPVLPSLIGTRNISFVEGINKRIMSRDEPTK